MEHADTAQLAALGGALGAVLVLLAAGRAARMLLLAGLALLALAELTLAWALGDGVLERLSGASGAATDQCVLELGALFRDREILRKLRQVAEDTSAPADERRRSA